jgi:hypothetical protein
MSLSLSLSLFNLCFLGIFLTLGCSESTSSFSPSPQSHNTASSTLTQIQAALRLPEGQECSVFRALHAESHDLVFEIEIDQARVRNHQYSFLYALESGEYDLKGQLECENDEYDSLNARFHLDEGQVERVDFRFFFDVDSDLNQIDLLFCAELFLSHLSPFSDACPNENVQIQYEIDWFREDCGEVFLGAQFVNELGDVFPESSAPFAFPQETVDLIMNAPDQTGSFDLSFFLHSQRGDRIELSSFPFDVVSCGQKDPVDETELPDDVGQCIEEDQMTRTPWQMHRGNEQEGPDGTEEVIRFDTPFSRHGDRAIFDYAHIPPPNDENNGGWVLAPDPQNIGLAERSRLCPEFANVACRAGADFNYFQSFMNLPNYSIDHDIRVDLRGIDDGALIVIYNDEHPQGLWIEESHVSLGNHRTINLIGFMEPGFNRVVIIHVDDCCGGSYLRSAQVELNQESVDAEECEDESDL